MLVPLLGERPRAGDACQSYVRFAVNGGGVLERPLYSPSPTASRASWGVLNHRKRTAWPSRIVHT